MVQIGHNTTDELWNIDFKRMRRFMDKVIPFIEVTPKMECTDMGEVNPKMEYLKEQLGIDVRQVTDIDFNFDRFYGKCDVIFALEVVEHLQNPLFFMMNLRDKLNPNGSIYVTIPCNPRWLWMDGHYNEIPRKHFEKWILKPLGLKVVRYKRINFVHNWKFTGVRPIIRMINGQESWKTMFRNILYFKYDLYEIKRD